MAYSGAKKCFTENCNLVGDPMRDPQNWNLNNGLHQFAQAVENDFAKLHHDIRDIDQKLERILRAVR